MTNSEFMKILNDDSLELTVEELENIIEEEQQKDARLPVYGYRQFQIDQRSVWT